MSALMVAKTSEASVFVPIITLRLSKIKGDAKRRCYGLFVLPLGAKPAFQIAQGSRKEMLIAMEKAQRALLGDRLSARRLAQVAGEVMEQAIWPPLGRRGFIP